MTRIVQAELLKRPIDPVAQMPRAGSTPRQSVLLRLTDDQGRIGQGEAAPLYGFTSDVFESALADLEEIREPAQRWWLEPGAGSIDRIRAVVDPLNIVPSARFAVETALLDLAAQCEEVSVARLLNPERIPVSVSVNWLLPTGASPELLVSTVERGLSQGVETFKAKIGRAESLDEEIRPLLALKQQFGTRATLRLDANEAWSAENAMTNLSKLLALDPEYVEQPVPREALFGLVDSPVPLAADETLQLPGALDRLITAANCKAVILKPAAMGGLLACRDSAARAAQAGLIVVVTHLFEGPIGVAAAAELALSLDPEPGPCGLAHHAGLESWSSVPPQLAPGRVVDAGLPGLGLPLVDRS